MIGDDIRLTEIYRVFDGDMRPGEIDNRYSPRRSRAFVYFLSGEVRYEFSDYSFTASAGTVVYLPLGGCYLMKIREKTSYICVDFDSIGESLSERGAVYRGIPPSTSEHFEQMLISWYKREPTSITDILASCYRVISECIASENKRYARSDLLSRAIEYILSDFTSEKLTVGAVAEKTGVSEAHLRRLFRAVMGISPMAYVNYLRFERARNMLCESNITVSEIAGLSGFSDPYYFSREFKRRFGVAPSEYKAVRAKGEI